MTDARPAEAEKPKGAAKGKADGEPKPDFTRPLTELTSAMWMVLAAAPIPPEPLRIKVRAQAKILRANQAGLVQGVNLMCQNNGVVRRGVEMLTMGGASWVLPATMAVAPFAVQSGQLWRMNPAELAGLAEQTEQEWAAEFEAMTAAMGLDEQVPGQEMADAA